jgi:hypothetical protein
MASRTKQDPEVRVVLDRSDHLVEGPAERAAESPSAAAASHYNASHALAWFGALVTAGAGVIHLLHGPENMREYTIYGWAFYAMAVAQIMLAGRVAFPTRSRQVVQAAIFVNLGICVLWALTRSVGLPIGPHPWTGETPGFPDLACLLLQVAGVLLLWPLVTARTSVRRLAERSLRAGPIFTVLVVLGMAVAPVVVHARNG